MKNMNFGKFGRDKTTQSSNNESLTPPQKSKSKLPFMRNKSEKVAAQSPDQTPAFGQPQTPKPKFSLGSAFKKKPSYAASGNVAAPSTNALKKQPNKNTSNLLLLILAVLILCAIGYLIFTKFLSPNPEVAPVATNSTNEVLTSEVATPEPVQQDNVNGEQATLAEMVEPEVNLDNVPDSEAILTAPYPSSDALAKEEIKRMDDEAMRLQEQERLVEEQIAMMDELTEKKDDQIQLFEQQVAQLEAQQE